MTETKFEMPDWMADRSRAGGTTKGVQWVVAEGNSLVGQMNGYVRLPETSPWYGIPVSLIEGFTVPARHMDTPTGLSWGDGVWVGFAPQDGFDDVGKFFSVAKVAAMTRKVARQIAEAAVPAEDMARIRAYLDSDGAYDRESFFLGYLAGRASK